MSYQRFAPRSPFSPGGLVRLLFIVMLGSIGLGCQSGGPGPSDGGDPSATTYYTRFAIQIDREFCRSTNYRGTGGGVMIPINTKVEFESKRRRRFNMRVVDGRSFMFEHVAKHTLDTPEAAFASFFSPQPVDLSSFSSKERRAIETGLIEIGMSRSAVLAAVGPPPAVGTPNLDAATWKYWTTRFITFTVHFDSNGRVSGKSR